MKFPKLEAGLFSGVKEKLSTVVDAAHEKVADGWQTVSTASKTALEALSPHVYEFYKNFQSEGSCLICTMIGGPGSGKTELMCLFDDFEKSLFGLDSERHASNSSGETRKKFSMSGAFSFSSDKIIISDGVGRVDAQDGRLRQIDGYIQDMLKTSKRIDYDRKRAPFMCFVLMDLRQDMGDKEFIYRLRAQLRVFKRTILERNYLVTQGKSSVEIALTPCFVVVGTHLDELKEGTEAAVVANLDHVFADVASMEGYSVNYAYRTIAADVYSTGGRKAFIQKFLDAKEELGV